MNLISEIRACLENLKEIRSFFLESNYEKEMERLERFVKICKEIQQLKQSGIFDDICDSAIRMAIREEKRGEKNETIN